MACGVLDTDGGYKAYGAHVEISIFTVYREIAKESILKAYISRARYCSQCPR
jgi:hypothetical protein